MARFYDDKTLLTVSACNARGEPYEILTLPMTAENVQGLDYKGSFLNYYVGNEVVPINVTALYQYGGMLHCVTQQQPAKP